MFWVLCRELHINVCREGAKSPRAGMLTNEVPPVTTPRRSEASTKSKNISSTGEPITEMVPPGVRLQPGAKAN